MFGAIFGGYRLAVRETRFIRVSLLASAGVNAAAWALFLWFALPRLGANPFFALHYTIYFGVDHIGPAWRVGAAPLLGTVILVLNAGLAGASYVRDRLAGAFLMAATALFQALLFFSTFLTVLLNV